MDKAYLYGVTIMHLELDKLGFKTIAFPFNKTSMAR